MIHGSHTSNEYLFHICMDCELETQFDVEHYLLEHFGKNFVRYPYDDHCEEDEDDTSLYVC